MASDWIGGDTSQLGSCRSKVSMRWGGRRLLRQDRRRYGRERGRVVAHREWSFIVGG